MATNSNPLSQVVSEKLTRENFLLWKAQILPAIRGAQLMGYLDGTTAAPAEFLDDEKKNRNAAVTPRKSKS